MNVEVDARGLVQGGYILVRLPQFRQLLRLLIDWDAFIQTETVIERPGLMVRQGSSTVKCGVNVVIRRRILDSVDTLARSVFVKDSSAVKLHP